MAALGWEMSGRDKIKSGDDIDENMWVFSPNNQAQKYVRPNLQKTAYSENSISTKVTDQMLAEHDLNGDIPINAANEIANKLYFDPPNKRETIKLRAELVSANIIDWLNSQLSYERDQGNLFNIAPIFFGIGIWTYFSVSFEPSQLILAASLIAVLLAVINIHSRGTLFHLAIIITLFIGGMSAAQIQVNRAQMHVPSTQITSKMTGIVLSVDKNTRGSPRYLIRPTYIERLNGQQLPTRIRLSTSKKHKKFKPGDAISGLSRLSPLVGPAYPGGYDFSFFAWFKGHAMSGFFMGEPEHSSITIKTNLLERTNIVLANWRGSVSARIRSGIKGESGELAVALITGDRSGLSQKTQESLRKSGLAHILAISGLHMALVTLTMVWLVRSALLLIPNLANKYAIKKWAIGVGFIVATLYLFLSGNAIATQRAWIMISIMMLASLLDRPAITIRSVAVAAFVILLIFPASLFSPGFQMSFAAVLALVSIYRGWNKYKQNKSKIPKDRGVILNSIGSVFKYGLGLSFTSLIAGTATAFFAAWHFHRIAPLGLIANLCAMPIVSILVMPLALVSVLLMPYGLEGLTLMPLGLAIEAVVWVSDKTNSIPLDFSTGIQSKQMLYSSLLLLAFALLPIGKLRFLSIVPAISLVYFLTQNQTVPHLLIAQDGRTIAVASNLLNTKVQLNNLEQKTGEGALTLLYPRRNKFVSRIWLKAYSGGISGSAIKTYVKKPNGKNSISKTPNCDKEQCNFMLGDRSVYIIYNPKLIAKACENANILLAPRLWYVRCKSKKPNIILKRQDFEKNGSHAIWLTTNTNQQPVTNKSTITIKTAWRPIEIEPTPDRYVDVSEVQYSVFKNETNTRRPWLRRYDLPRRYKSKNNKK